MLIRLFSETNLLLKSFQFEPGINIILGRYSKNKENRGPNGIGKSSLIRLIDYVLLSDSSEKRFSNERYDFLRKEKHNVILEFKINDERFFIKRHFVDKDIVYFGKNTSQYEKYTKSELKQILFNKYFPIEKNDVFLDGNRFGTLMNFFIKDDLESLKRVDPLNFLPYRPSSREIAILNFYLLNLSNKYLIRYDELIKEYDSYKKGIKALQDKVKLDTGKSIEEFKSQKIKIEKSIALLESALRDYKFLETYKGIETQLIEISAQINDKLKAYHSFSNKHKKIQDSFQQFNDIDLKQIRKLYNEVLKTFGDIVSKTLNEIIEFRTEINDNRNKYLIFRQNQLEKSIGKILDDISELEQERSLLYKRLDERGAIESITNTYEQLTIEKTNLAKNLEIIRQVEEIQVMLGNLDVSISEIKRDILNELTQYSYEINELRILFQEILSSAIFIETEKVNGYFDISLKNNSNRNELPFKIDVEIPKADALGLSRLKIITYDLLVFLNNINSERRFPNFLIHDGVYHGITINTKIKALNYIYHKFLNSPKFQYITTFNEDEIYLHPEGNGIKASFDFEFANMIIAEFSDTPENMLFKRSFQ